MLAVIRHRHVIYGPLFSLLPVLDVLGLALTLGLVVTVFTAA